VKILEITGNLKILEVENKDDPNNIIKVEGVENKFKTLKSLKLFEHFQDKIIKEEEMEKENEYKHIIKEEEEPLKFFSVDYKKKTELNKLVALITFFEKEIIENFQIKNEASNQDKTICLDKDKEELEGTKKKNQKILERNVDYIDYINKLGINENDDDIKNAKETFLNKKRSSKPLFKVYKEIKQTTSPTIKEGESYDFQLQKEYLKNHIFSLLLNEIKPTSKIKNFNNNTSHSIENNQSKQQNKFNNFYQDQILDDKNINESNFNFAHLNNVSNINLKNVYNTLVNSLLEESKESKSNCELSNTKKLLEIYFATKDNESNLENAKKINQMFIEQLKFETDIKSQGDLLQKEESNIKRALNFKKTSNKSFTFEDYKKEENKEPTEKTEKANFQNKQEQLGMPQQSNINYYNNYYNNNYHFPLPSNMINFNQNSTSQQTLLNLLFLNLLTSQNNNQLNSNMHNINIQAEDEEKKVLTFTSTKKESFQQPRMQNTFNSSFKSLKSIFTKPSTSNTTQFCGLNCMNQNSFQKSNYLSNNSFKNTPPLSQINQTSSLNNNEISNSANQFLNSTYLNTQQINPNQIQQANQFFNSFYNLLGGVSQMNQINLLNSNEIQYNFFQGNTEDSMIKNEKNKRIPKSGNSSSSKFKSNLTSKRKIKDKAKSRENICITKPIPFRINNEDKENQNNCETPQSNKEAKPIITNNKNSNQSCMSCNLGFSLNTPIQPTSSFSAYNKFENCNNLVNSKEVKEKMDIELDFLNNFSGNNNRINNAHSSSKCQGFLSFNRDSNKLAMSNNSLNNLFFTNSNQQTTIKKNSSNNNVFNTNFDYYFNTENYFEVSGDSKEIKKGGNR